MSDSAARRGGASPVPAQGRQPFSADAFDDFMSLSKGEDAGEAKRTAPAAANKGAAGSGHGNIGRKFRSFPWSRSDKKGSAPAEQKHVLISSSGSIGPKPGPSILKSAGSAHGVAASGPHHASSNGDMPRQRAATDTAALSSRPGKSHPSSNASLSTASSFASTSLFGSTEDAGWHSEATSVSLSSAGGSVRGGTSDSLSKMRNHRRVIKETSGGVRPFSVLSDIVERENEDARASMYDVLSMYSTAREIPVRRVSTPIPPAVAAMLACEPATPPRQKRWSTSSIDEGSPSAVASDGDADAELSPPRLRRRNSFDSPRSSETPETPNTRLARSIRIPSMRFDGISMDAMFAEVEARVNRELALKGLEGPPTTSSSLPDIAPAVAKKARRKSRVTSLQEPLAFEISQPVFQPPAGSSVGRIAKPTSPPREATILEEEEEEESLEPVVAPPSRTAAVQQIPKRTSSRPEPLDMHAANSVPRWSPRSAPLQAAAPFFATETVTSPICGTPTSPTPSKGALASLLPPVDSIGTASGASDIPHVASPRLQTSIPELLVCPPSPPERPKRRAPPPPPLQLAAKPSASSVPFPTFRPTSNTSQHSPPLSAPLRHVTVINGETKVTVLTDKKVVRLSTRAQNRRADRSRTFSVPIPLPQSMRSPTTPLTPTFEITPPPPDSPVDEAAGEQTAGMAPASQPSTPVRRTFGVATGSSSVPVSPPKTPTSAVAADPSTAADRVGVHSSPSNLTVTYPNSDESSSECEESFQDMLVRLNRPHTPPRKATKAKTASPRSADSSPTFLTKTAMELHNTAHSRLSMLARELGETMLAKENEPVARLDRPRIASNDSRRYSKLFTAGEVNLEQFDGAAILVSQAEPLSPTVMHHALTIDSEHGHAGDESWTARGSYDGLDVDVPTAPEEPEHDLESELDRTIASLIDDETKSSSAASNSSGAMSRSESHASHARTDSTSSVGSLDAAAIVEAKVIVPRSPVVGVGHRSTPSDSSIGSNLTEAEEGVVCLGERISCSYNRGVIGVAM
ncbi:hypothetical protein BMF94_0437 [Rhodotorula taiwanensis]|uniref:Uncharacterized protein n=1 Tax=Rhodotorula taiwanensis TaxID=741276 RepID=A0A2S5BHK3_9BASI|nr:hypothetical protein BMF94_0437 [Rhodotorula taiwanensis]